MTGGSTPAALLADWLVSIYDQNLSVHLPQDSIATNVEVASLNQLVDLFHLPRDQWGIGASSSGGGGGTLTTGATASNVLGLAIGREWVLSQAAWRKTGEKMSVGEHGIYETMMAAGVTKIQVLSTLPHSSIAKACSVVGLGRNCIISVIKEGTDLEIDVDKVREEVWREGVVNILVVSAGEINTGGFATTGWFEDWRSLRKLCDENGVWIHVDGAFGLFGRVLRWDPSEEYRTLIKGVEGIELADSITGDAHKLLNVPYDCGFFFTRHKKLSIEVFNNAGAAYLKGVDDGVQSPMNIGIENSRRFRALPVHATLVAYGREGYVDLLKRQIGLARRVTRWLVRDGRYEVLPGWESEREVVEKTFMVVLFRARDEVLNEQLVKKINATGKMYVTGTSWKGKPAARIAVSNWRTEIERDGKLVEAVLDEVAR